jgi:hypothetical protein
VTLRILDGKGAEVRRFSSDETAEALPAERYFEERWMGTPQRLSPRAGAHRFVWDLRRPRPHVDAYSVSIAAVDGDAARLVPEGMLVPPGRYTVELAVDGRRQRSILDVVADPRVPVGAAALAHALALADDVGSALDRESLANGQVQAVHAQLDALAAKASDKPAAAQALAAFAARLAPLLEGEGEQAPMNLSVLGGELTALAADLEGSDAAPTAPQRALYATDAQRLEQALQLWTTLRQEALPSLDATLAAAGLPAVRVPARREIRTADAGASREMP